MTTRIAATRRSTLCYAAALVTFIGLGGFTPALGQQTTERFIPIGMSPGLSGTYTWLGEITNVDASARTVTVRGESGERTIRITDSTRIWVDRSGIGEQNTVGNFGELQVGRRTEIKYLDRERREVADWIKVAPG